MAESFDKMSAAIDRVNELVTEAINIFKNPVVDNNNQATIDAMTIRLNSISDALSGLKPVSVTPTPAPDPAAPAASADTAAAAAPAADTTTPPVSK